MSIGVPSAVILPGDLQRIVQEHAQQVGVEFRRQARGVRIPVEDVEGRRPIAHDPVVGDEQPHQVVGPQPREYARHLAALEHALARGIFRCVAATPVCDANWPSIVGASVSSTVTSSVALSILSSPFAGEVT